MHLEKHVLQEDMNEAFRIALNEASKFRGQTAPNPPVGAVALDDKGKIIGIAAHEKAGTAHAEAKLISELRASKQIDRLDTLLVTLEPCNHFGRTPPCVDAILASPAKRIVIAAFDPNPTVQGGGMARLRAAGRHVLLTSDLDIQAEAKRLIAPFKKWSETKIPFVTLKIARSQSGSQIPPVGQKTFTSTQSLTLAHELRKRSNAVLTGMGTVLADLPLFTVRNVPDFVGMKRWLVVLSRTRALPEAWVKAREQDGFQVRLFRDVQSALVFLGEQGCLDLLVEAGPAITQLFESKKLWDERVVITQTDASDRVEWTKREE